MHRVVIACSALLLTGCATFEQHGPTVGLGISLRDTKDENGNVIHTSVSPYFTAGYAYLLRESLFYGYGGRFDLQYVPLESSFRIGAAGTGCLLATCFDVGVQYEAAGESSGFLFVAGFTMAFGYPLALDEDLPPVEDSNWPRAYPKWDAALRVSVDTYDFRSGKGFGDGLSLMGLEGLWSLHPRRGHVDL